MSIQSVSDSADNLKEKAGSALDSLKETAREKVIDPVVQAGKDLSSAARDGAAKVADYGRKAAHSTDEWVDSHPYPTAGIAFGFGILLGVVIGMQIRS
jgi:ElaB/YqjD/DUF883 family membrane-anchored ribosome-binding protein